MNLIEKIESSDFKVKRWWKYTKDLAILYKWSVLIAIVIGYINFFFLKFVILKIGNIYESSKSTEAVQHYLNFRDFYIASLTLSGLFFIIYTIGKAKKDDFFSASFLLPVST
ncbi:MAG TPA: hypothetical protein PKD85_21515, partial [Saprospiraceae bacterium]|nr:hypothetical protein [Saprospiraceae bacterium]